MLVSWLRKLIRRIRRQDARSRSEYGTVEPIDPGIRNALEGFRG